MKRILRSVLRSRIIHAAGIWGVACWIRLVYYSCIKHYQIHPEAAPYLAGTRPAIFSFWHGRMLMIPHLCPPGRPMHVLISLHRDGVFISAVMRQFGFHTIAGSTSKNGREAFMRMLRVLKQGDNVAITPDGPRGPAQQASAGIIATAKLSGVPIVPLTFAASRCKRASSWDRFMVALPFGRLLFVAGAPMRVDKSDADRDAMTGLERAMNELAEHADAALL